MGQFGADSHGVLLKNSLNGADCTKLFPPIAVNRTSSVGPPLALWVAHEYRNQADGLRAERNFDPKTHGEAPRRGIAADVQDLDQRSLGGNARF